MGIDLRLLPCEHWHEENGRTWGYSHTILELGRVWESAHDAFLRLVKPHVTQLPVGHDVSSFVGARVLEGVHQGERIYGTIRDKDAYGELYEVVAAQHLLPWLVEHFRCGGSSFQTAIVTFIRMLPPDTKVVLDWH